MAIDKTLLRKALCDGAFGNVANTGETPPTNRPFITPAVLAAVANMTDDLVNATLTLYASNKSAQLQAQIAQLQTRVTSIQADIDALPVVQIAPQPTPVTLPPVS